LERPACHVRSLFDGERIKFAELICPPNSIGWGQEEMLGSRTNIAFPRGGAFIRRSGRSTVLANRNHVVVYSPYREYCHHPVDRQAWSCSYLAIEDDALSDALERSGRDEIVDGPLERRAYLLQYAAAKAAEGRDDALLAEEFLYQLLDESLSGMGAIRASSAGRTDATRRAHHELVEEAKRVITVRMADRLSVEALARELYVSPFHLARVFRANTGYTLHAYRNELRLRCALDLIDQRRGDLASLAQELGFASLSHFSDNFYRAFGMRPTAIPLTVRYSSWILGSR
jgi:AraC-like DNA-binding protein